MKKKKVFKYVLMIVLLMVSIDIILVNIFKFRPIFTIPFGYSDGGSVVYFGLGYKVLKCHNMMGDTSTHLGFYNMKFKCNSDSISKDYKIIDNKDSCLEGKEEIARDNNYIYYFACVNNSPIYLELENGILISITSALNRKLVTIHELIDKGLEVHKEPINSIDNTQNNTN